jgi:predicted DNA binding CopG/RHH family protein
MTKGYEQRKQANEKYLSTQDRITIRVPKESCMKETIQTHAEKCGESVQAFILRAILAQIERDEQESGAE